MKKNVAVLIFPRSSAISSRRQIGDVQCHAVSPVREVLPCV